MGLTRVGGYPRTGLATVRTVNRLDSEGPKDLAELPPRLGRYEVAGLLATGGMAEIWLARVVGPFDFERVVVCKRIFPHLARQSEFVSMFVDEALIASGIHHPNVVQVHELVHEEGELFLVMEYLAGESLGSVLRRLASREESLPPELAAYIVAEACSGLHAAHELKDEQGFPRDLVHRDISPQNLFVTYSGQVKLLDFGIAKAADRRTQTEAGQVKGKFAYMSPEQCQGKALDRRSDVFSMGIVLWESLSGARLFARSSELLTFRAICEDPTPPLLGPGAEIEELVAACDRALERSKVKRFPTAMELRRQLLPVVRRSAIAEHPDHALAALMARLFPDRIEAKREVLIDLKAGKLPADVPIAEVDEDVRIPTLGEVTAATRSPSVTQAGQGARAAARTRWLALGGVTLGALLLAWFRPWSTGVEAPKPGSSTLAVAQSTPPLPSVSTEGGTVSFSVETTPTGATLKLGPQGALRALGTTPTSVALPKGDTTLLLELSLDGYRTHSETLVPNMSQRVVVALERSPKAGGSSPRQTARRRPPEAATSATASEPRPIPRFR